MTMTTASLAVTAGTNADYERQRGGIAVLDLDGNVTWTDEAWTADDEECDLARVPIGTNLLATYRGSADRRAQAVARVIVAVFEGKATYFEIEHRASRAGRSVLTSVTALPGDGAGAVLIHTVVGRRAPPNSPRRGNVMPTGGASIGIGVERLTPREREVLGLMAVGLDNRAIAAKLGIQYTTVRGHVRSVIEKLGARSARGGRLGLPDGSRPDVTQVRSARSELHAPRPDTSLSSIRRGGATREDVRFLEFLPSRSEALQVAGTRVVRVA